MPWSDPSADGKVIQAAIDRALASGGGLRRTLPSRARRARGAPRRRRSCCSATPTRSSCSGAETLRRKARRGGRRRRAVRRLSRPTRSRAHDRADARSGLDCVPLLAPTSTPARIARRVSRGGRVHLLRVDDRHHRDARWPTSTRRGPQVAAIRDRSGGKLPIAVGFGIRTPGAAARHRQLRRRRRRRQRRGRGDQHRRDGRPRSGPRALRVRQIAARRDQPSDALASDGQRTGGAICPTRVRRSTTRPGAELLGHAGEDLAGAAWSARGPAPRSQPARTASCRRAARAGCGCGTSRRRCG